MPSLFGSLLSIGRGKAPPTPCSTERVFTQDDLNRARADGEREGREKARVNGLERQVGALQQGQVEVKREVVALKGAVVRLETEVAGLRRDIAEPPPPPLTSPRIDR